MASRLTIRPADPGESEALGRLAREAKAFWGYSAAQLERWRDDLTVSPASIRRFPTFVATADGTVVGFVQINTAASPWELEHLWVAPRQMRRGIGRALLAHAGEAVARAGQTMLAIDADPHAEAFYLAVGARRIGAIAAPIEGEGDRVRPQLRLAVGAVRS